ncbi:LemA family protein [Pseudoalteromonas sp. THAF3]|uniref:LemA family protein n=1 Tax=Pseudoalteromonas ruthenica TaxID=151081 RepID=A0A5S3Z1Y3_9GAMM|nr:MULTISPECIES: LemA family protein [Pseudoalteromonas]MCF2863900.1 LemA family protein [Pseudoalteromonas sp. CNAT2-18]MCG7545197.1 LemA family protein [Pseudoalteromonas sp. MM17-2]MCG7559821.1 LemA family protein [Pseudoalteromonas sp. CNAT2-18.1]MCG7568118.1 LemA family protein [Pseudoalteromonas sp. CnMc7-15]MCG7571769.1 LemA family protein [Pseudoalteromonas sp. CNC9-20]|tara:strand:+ start:7156 stop:7743 length:588 start_codon:yes stop_codon:yes gene_type:complete
MELFLIITAVVVVIAIVIYNSLVRYKNEYQNAFAQIDVQLHRRHDLVPNLVATAQAYLDHESETLKAVTQARNQAVSALQSLSGGELSSAKLAHLAQTEGALSSALGALQVSIEDYPELKADATMANLSEELSSTENRIAFARQAYNDSVLAYNSYRQSFPPVLIANMTGHNQDAKLLELDDPQRQRQAPSVSFK